VDDFILNKKGISKNAIIPETGLDLLTEDLSLRAIDGDLQYFPMSRFLLEIGLTIVLLLKLLSKKYINCISFVFLGHTLITSKIRERPYSSYGIILL